MNKQLKAKEPKQIISNPFKLYYAYDDDTQERREENQRATRQFKRCWKNFIIEWTTLQKLYDMDLGARDTEARDAQVEWIKKHSIDVF